MAHVQEGAWPDLRRRDTLLHADRLGAPGAGLVPPRTRGAVLAEERRLFYVAVTRARQRLVVTAVASPDEDGEQRRGSPASSARPPSTGSVAPAARCR